MKYTYIRSMTDISISILSILSVIGSSKHISITNNFCLLRLNRAYWYQVFEKSTRMYSGISLKLGRDHTVTAKYLCKILWRDTAVLVHIFAPQYFDTFLLKTLVFSKEMQRSASTKKNYSFKVFNIYYKYM